MIEVLIKYITDHGYEVEVRPPVNDILPGSLVIRKHINGEVFQTYWCIPKNDLHPDMEDGLYWIADNYMRQMEQAIAEWYGSAVV